MNTEEGTPHHNEDIPRLVPRNQGHSPALNLSSDALLSIFFLFRDLNVKNVGSLRDSRGYLWDWLTVTRVCRRWRNVALECPGLWTDIYRLSNPDKIREFLERSGDADIKVSLVVTRTTADQTLRLFDRHMWRVREFNVKVSFRGWCSVFPLLDALTERVKAVELIHKHSDSITIHDVKMLLMLPDVLPGVQLSSLTLRNITLPWTCTIYHGLSQLIIKDDYNFLEKPSIWQLKEILEHCPALRRLELGGVHPTLSESDISLLDNANARLELPLLECVVLSKMEFSNCAYFFKIVDVGKNVRLYMFITEYPFDNPQPLPKVVLIGRKDCESVNVEMSASEFLIQSKVTSRGRCKSSLTNIIVDIHTSRHSLRHRLSLTPVASILEYQYWKTAKAVTVSFDYRYGFKDITLDSDSWAIILDALPNTTKNLQVKLLSEDHRYHDTLSLCLSSMLAKPNPDGMIKFQGLEQFVISNLHFAEDLGRARYDGLLTSIKERNSQVKKPLNICFSRCAGISTELDGVDFVPA